MVSRHQFNRKPRQNTLAPVRSLVQHHLTKGQIVINGRDQPVTASREDGRAALLAVFDAIVEFKRPAFGIELVTARVPCKRKVGMWLTPPVGIQVPTEPLDISDM